MDDWKVIIGLLQLIVNSILLGFFIISYIDTRTESKKNDPK